MTRKIARIPRLSEDCTVNLAILAMAASMPDVRESAETMAECAEDLAAHGQSADALEWFSRIVEGGEPQLGPHAALRIAWLLVDDDAEAAQAALRYAADHGTPEVARFAVDNQRVLAQHGTATRTEPANREEVVGRTAVARGVMLNAEGDHDAALEALRQAVECPVPDISARGLAYLGSTHVLRGDEEAAVDVLDQVIATGHPHYAPMAALDLSGILNNRGRPEHAMDVLRRAQSGQGWAAAMAGVNLGTLLVGEGDVAGGIAELRRVAAGDEPLAVAAALFNLGNVLEDDGDLAGAREAYEKAAGLRQPRFSGQAAINLGVLLSAKQLDIRGAHTAFRLAAEVGDPGDVAQADRMLAQLAELGELDEVHASVQDLDLSDPDVVGKGRLFAGEQLLRDGDLEAALRAFEKAMDTGHPIHAPEGAAWVALAFLQAHGMHGAETAIGRLAEIGRPDLVPRAWFMFGCRLANGGRLKDADKLWKQLAKTGGDARAAAECGREVVRGNAAKAEAAFQDVLATSPDLVDHLGVLTLHAGDLHMRNGDRAAARAAFRLARVFGVRSGLSWLVEQADEAAAQV